MDNLNTAALSDDEGECSKHPCAPHGFNRNASHSEDRYVCDCEGWSPDRACAGLRLEARLAALEADARRYRWLISNTRNLHCGRGGWFTAEPSEIDARGFPPYGTRHYPSSAEAIDAALLNPPADGGK